MGGAGGAVGGEDDLEAGAMSAEEGVEMGTAGGAVGADESRADVSSEEEGVAAMSAGEARAPAGFENLGQVDDRSGHA